MTLSGSHKNWIWWTLCKQADKAAISHQKQFSFSNIRYCWVVGIEIKRTVLCCFELFVFLLCTRLTECLCYVSGFSASSPVKAATPPDPVQPQDSPDPGSSSQESLPATDDSKDAFAPKPDPDAWIQVEKRHRQPSAKAKVVSAKRWNGPLPSCLGLL